MSGWRLLPLSALVFRLAQPAPPDAIWAPGRQHYALVERSDLEDWACRITIRSARGVKTAVAHAWRKQPDGTLRVSPRECSLRWIDASRLACQGSINPSTLVHLVFDASTGRELHQFFGLEFAWSPDGRTLASRGNVPHFMDWNEKSDSLEVNGKRVYPPANATGRRLFRSALSWSPDSLRIAVVCQNVGQRAVSLLFADPSGIVTERNLPWPPGNSSEFPAPAGFTITWQGRTAVVQHAAGPRTVKVAP